MPKARDDVGIFEQEVLCVGPHTTQQLRLSGASGTRDHDHAEVPRRLLDDGLELSPDVSHR